MGLRRDQRQCHLVWSSLAGQDAPGNVADDVVLAVAAQEVKDGGAERRCEQLLLKACVVRDTNGLEEVALQRFHVHGLPLRRLPPRMPAA